MTVIHPNDRDALIVVDVQNDFCPGGALAVAGGDEIVPVINAIASTFAKVVLTQDWHPVGHVSFASTHGEVPFSRIRVAYGDQVMWPDHCVQGTRGAEIHPDLDIPHAQAVIRKGHAKDADSYSGLVEADGIPTGLSGYLKERGVERVFVVGLATDYCVAWTAIDAARDGFEVFVIEDATRAIDLGGSLERAWSDMKAAGVRKAEVSSFIYKNTSIGMRD